MTDKTSKLIQRIGVFGILLVVLLFMFVFNPHENADKFSNETMWEAVHPFKPVWDTLALVGLISFWQAV